MFSLAKICIVCVLDFEVFIYLQDVAVEITF